MTGLKINKILLTDYHSFPSVIYYKLLDRYKELKFEQYEHFRKGSYSNRYYIGGANGRILLSVPLFHSGREKVPLKDLRISNRDKWQLIHWRTLTSAYRRSPWFEYFEELLHPMYEKKFEYLTDWDLEGFELINGLLGFSWKISHTEEYIKEYPADRFEDARNKIMPKNLLENKKEVSPSYHQVFEDRTGFIPGLSVLDLLFCEGKNARELIRNQERVK